MDFIHIFVRIVDNPLDKLSFINILGFAFLFLPFCK